METAPFLLHRLVFDGMTLIGVIGFWQLFIGGP